MGMDICNLLPGFRGKIPGVGMNVSRTVKTVQEEKWNQKEKLYCLLW